jgi:hypothetical protein
MLQLLPLYLRLLLAQVLWNTAAPPAPEPRPLTFTLRHQHSVTQGSRIIFSETNNPNALVSDASYTIRTKPMTVHRPTSMTAHATARSRSMRFGQTTSSSLLWDEALVEGPDVVDRETLLTLAKMTNNAYYDSSNQTGWYDLGPKWNTVRLGRVPPCFASRCVLICAFCIFSDLAIWLGTGCRRFPRTYLRLG